MENKYKFLSPEQLINQKRLFLTPQGYWISAETGAEIYPESQDGYEYGQYLSDGSFENRKDIKHKIN